MLDAAGIETIVAGGHAPFSATKLRVTARNG